MMPASDHAFLECRDLPANALLKLDEFVNFARENIDALKRAVPPCYVENQKISSLSWYLLIQCRDIDTVYESMYDFVVSRDVDVTGIRFNKDLIYDIVNTGDSVLLRAMQQATSQFPQTRLFVAQSAKVLQTFRDVLAVLYHKRVADLQRSCGRDRCSANN